MPKNETTDGIDEALVGTVEAYEALSQRVKALEDAAKAQKTTQSVVFALESIADVLRDLSYNIEYKKG